MKAVAVLEPLSPLFHDQSGCFSCHNNSLPEAALNLALTHGVAVNRKAAAHAAQAALGDWKSRVDDYLLATCATPGFVVDTTKGLLGLAEEGVAPNYITDALTSCLASLQQPEGDWQNLTGIDFRPPLTGSPIVSTALAIRGLKEYLPPGRRDEVKVRIDRALGFIRAAASHDTQDETYKLLGLIWAGAPAAEAAAQARRLLALQRAEGGWGQVPTMEPDAYATGQALTRFTPAGERLRLSRTRKACSTSFVPSSKMGPGLSAREPSDFSRISNRVFLMERISSFRRRRHPGLRWRWHTRNRK